MNAQEKILELQKQLTELSAELNEVSPDADEALVAFLDLGERAITWVREFLHKLG